jgi:arsenate reductase
MKLRKEAKSHAAPHGVLASRLLPGTVWRVRTSVLFVCIHNSARSQMAEAFVNAQSPALFHAESAGIEPGKLDPIVVAAMHEAGIDISLHATKSVHDMVTRARPFDYVITVCEEANAENCAIFPDGGQRLHWGFPDPLAYEGTAEEKLAGTRAVRDLIRARVEAFCAALHAPAST